MVHVFKNAYLEYIHYMLYKITGYILINVNKHLQFKKCIDTQIQPQRNKFCSMLSE